MEKERLGKYSCSAELTEKVFGVPSGQRKENKETLWWNEKGKKST